MKIESEEIQLLHPGFIIKRKQNKTKTMKMFHDQYVNTVPKRLACSELVIFEN